MICDRLAAIKLTGFYVDVIFGQIFLSFPHPNKILTLFNLVKVPCTLATAVVCMFRRTVRVCFQSLRLDSGLWSRASITPLHTSFDYSKRKLYTVYCVGRRKNAFLIRVGVEIVWYNTDFHGWMDGSWDPYPAFPAAIFFFAGAGDIAKEREPGI